MLDHLFDLHSAHVARVAEAQRELEVALARGDHEAIGEVRARIKESEAALEVIYWEIRVVADENEERDLDLIRRDPARFLDAVGDLAPRLLGDEYDVIAALRGAQDVVDGAGIVLPTRGVEDTREDVF